MKLKLALLSALLLTPEAQAADKAPKPPKGGADSQKAIFRKSHPCPSNGKTSGACPGYVVTYITPPKKGGAHTATNMQWLTNVEAKGQPHVK